MENAKTQEGGKERRNDSKAPLNIVFLHLDLGIGGAEQLVVNAAMAVLHHGHNITVYTTHHHHGHCFAETTGQGALAQAVRVWGDWLPRTLLGGRFTALCAAVRMIYLALVVVLLEVGRVDAIFLDGVSVSLPLLLLTGTPVLFYCHFPDKLLCVDRQSLLKRCYRLPFDIIEEVTTLLAHRVVVNSNFTLQTFLAAFQLYGPMRNFKLKLNDKLKFLKLIPPSLEVLYPPINLDSFVTRHEGGVENEGRKDDLQKDEGKAPPAPPPPPSSSSSSSSSSFGPIVSLNRFERKKNILLAVEALAALRDSLQVEADSRADIREIEGSLVFDEKIQLVIAGGCEESVTENVEYKREIEARVSELKLNDNVTLATNISDDQRAHLLSSASMVLYTPHNEHFGIVPLEAMYAGAPVICVKSGGPLETVIDGETGFLCEQTPGSFAAAMRRILEEPTLTRSMGMKGYRHVRDKFSLEAFGRSLNTLFVNMVVEYKRQRYGSTFAPLTALLVAVLAITLSLALKTQQPP